MLSMVAEKVLPLEASPKTLAYCPTMDLVAVASVDDQINVYRLNGQKVFGVLRRQFEAKINAVIWKPNGKKRSGG